MKKSIIEHLLHDCCVQYKFLVEGCKCGTDREILYPVINLMIKNYATEIRRM